MRWRATLAPVVGIAIAIVGCRGTDPPGRPPDTRELECETTAVICPGGDDGRDMTGACLEPEEVSSPPGAVDPVCGDLDSDVDPESTEAAATGQTECQEDVCDNCLRDGTCESCETTFVAWGSSCPGSVPIPGGTGPGPDPDPDPIPGPGYHVLTFVLDVEGSLPQDLEIEPDPIRVTSLETDAAPVAIVARSQLWVLFEDARLITYDLAEDPPTRDKVIQLEGVTGPTSLQFYSRRDLGGLWAIVGAANGVHQFRIDGEEATRVAVVERMNVRDAEISAVPLFREDGLVTFASTMPNRLWLTRRFGVDDPAMAELELAIPIALTLEPEEAPRVWLGTGIDPTIQRWPFSVDFGGAGSFPTRREAERALAGRAVVDVGGGELFDSIRTGEGEGALPVTNPGVVVASNSADAAHLTYHLQGSFRDEDTAEIALEGSVQAIDVAPFEDMVVFAALARPNRVRVFLPTAPTSAGFTEITDPLFLEDEPLALTVSLDISDPEIPPTGDGGPPPDGGPPDPPSSKTAALHVVVLR